MLIRHSEIGLRALIVACCLLLRGGEAQAVEDGSCGKTLEQIASQEFQGNTPGINVCPPYIQSYVSFAGFVLAAKGELSEQELHGRLLKAAEDGYLNAEIIYTLLFDPYAGKFGKDFFVKRDYSRYAPFIISLRFFDDWRKDHVADKFFIANELANEAAHQGVIEAYLFRYVFNYFQYAASKNEAHKRDAAVSLLVFADFLNRTDAARRYLARIFDLRGAELDPYEAESKKTIAEMLNDPENSACGQERVCVLDQNIKRVICDIRDLNGKLLHRIGERNCARLSKPLIQVYRQAVAGAFDGFISGVNP